MALVTRTGKTTTSIFPLAPHWKTSSAGRLPEQDGSGDEREVSELVPCTWGGEADTFEATSIATLRAPRHTRTTQATEESDARGVKVAQGIGQSISNYTPGDRVASISFPDLTSILLCRAMPGEREDPRGTSNEPTARLFLLTPCQIVRRRQQGVMYGQ